MTTQASNTQTANTETYFDLHTTGVGYVNRIREVKVKKGSFWACDIAALHGSKDEVETTRFDCRISGQEAERLIKRCVDAQTAEKKIIIGFKLGDLSAETFEYKTGTKKGETGISLKARLLYVGWIKVDGEMVYQAPKQPKTDLPEHASNEQTDQSQAIEGELLDPEESNDAVAA